MSEIIAHCGLDCAKCDALTATQMNNIEKEEMAKRWMEGLNVKFNPEDIDRAGCMSDKISGWRTKVCRIRSCAEARKVKTCAHCEDYFMHETGTVLIRRTQSSGKTKRNTENACSPKGPPTTGRRLPLGIRYHVAAKKRRRMKDDRRLRELRSRLEKQGCKSRVVSIRRIRDLQESIERNRAQGLLNEEFFQEWLTDLSFKVPDALPDAQSLIVVAAPQPQVRVVFTWKGEPRPVIIPPTYLHGTDKIAERILSDILDPERQQFARATLPLKLLAVRSGLGDYGRNNICYVPGFGSFHRLSAYYLKIPCSDESWREPKMMEDCQNCQACRHACKAGAITADRFLIRAERCLTFHNERPRKFPDWVDPSWHNCLIGCMHCQRVCPENIDVRDWVEGDQVFSEEETTHILNSTRSNHLPRETARKLEQLDLLEDSRLLGRNLYALLKRQEQCQVL